MLRHAMHTALFVLALMSANAAAQDSPRYVKIAAGVSYLEDTRNGGRTTAPVDPGLIEGQLTQGGAYVFETVYDDGPFAALAFGAPPHTTAAASAAEHVVEMLSKDPAGTRRRNVYAPEIMYIQPGDTVTVLSPNIPEMFELHYAVPLAGAVLNTVNTRLEAETIAYILDHADSTLVIADTHSAPVLREAFAKLDLIEQLLNTLLLGLAF